MPTLLAFSTLQTRTAMLCCDFVVHIMGKLKGFDIVEQTGKLVLGMRKIKKLRLK